MAREVVLQASRRRRRRLQAHNVSYCENFVRRYCTKRASCGVLQTLTCVLNQTQPAEFYYEIV